MVRVNLGGGTLFPFSLLFFQKLGLLQGLILVVEGEVVVGEYISAVGRFDN
jgi:hypothetical protein